MCGSFLTPRLIRVRCLRLESVAVFCFYRRFRVGLLAWWWCLAWGRRKLSHDVSALWRFFTVAIARRPGGGEDDPLTRGPRDGETGRVLLRTAPHRSHPAEEPRAAGDASSNLSWIAWRGAASSLRRCRRKEAEASSLRKPPRSTSSTSSLIYTQVYINTFVL